MDLVSIQLEMKKLKGEIEIDPELRGVLFSFDQQRLEQILINLLQNALKFTTKGFVKTKVKKAPRNPSRSFETLHINDTEQSKHII